MKAKDLMIGDWVLLYDKPRKVEIIYDYDRVQVDCIEEDCTALSSIPLTTEIMEKNGFKSWEHGYIWKERVGMGGQTTSASSPIEIIIYEGGHSVIINPHAGKEFQGSIDNVHELQHALRLCGINKEIVI